MQKYIKIEKEKKRKYIEGGRGSVRERDDIIKWREGACN
jgi:hypothetical protein